MAYSNKNQANGTQTAGLDHQTCNMTKVFPKAISKAKQTREPFVCYNFIGLVYVWVMIGSSPRAEPEGGVGEPWLPWLFKFLLNSANEIRITSEIASKFW